MTAEAKSRQQPLGAVELAFLGDALEGFTGTLDPVLIVVTFGRQQLDYDIAAGRRGAAKSRRGVEDRFTNLVFVRPNWDFVRGNGLHGRAWCTDYFCRLYTYSATYSTNPCRPGGLSNRDAGRFRRFFRRKARVLVALFCDSPDGFTGPPGCFC